jgi:hypothetical protein
MDLSHQLQAPATLPPWKQTVPGTQWIGGWVHLRGGVDTMEKKYSLVSAGNQTLAIQLKLGKLHIYILNKS